ncbi:MAG: hypothetical protein KOO66_02035 [Bacteroidales bacterium]|nr:hypothetical protein [Bacteroidales bacterium]
MDNQFIIAHRGESFDAPENTLSSINLAWENGADAVEVDIRLTKDNQIVVIHDANTWRVFRKFRWIRNTELKELKRLDVGKYKNRMYKGERIPTLQEVLSTVPNGKKILIEIKSDRKIIPYLKNVIDDSALQTKQIEIISFKLSTLIEVKKQLPQYSVLWIQDFDSHRIRKFFYPSIHKIILKAIKYNFQGLDLSERSIADKAIVEKTKSVGLVLYTWTVNNPEKAKSLFDMGVDGITTDRAKWIKNQLEFYDK